MGRAKATSGNDTIYAVILNAVKNLLKADKRQPALIAHSKRGDASRCSA